MARNNSKARREQRRAVADANEELRQKYGVRTVKQARHLESIDPLPYESDGRIVTAGLGTQDEWELV